MEDIEFLPFPVLQLCLIHAVSCTEDRQLSKYLQWQDQHAKLASTQSAFLPNVAEVKSYFHDPLRNLCAESFAVSLDEIVAELQRDSLEIDEDLVGDDTILTSRGRIFINPVSYKKFRFFCSNAMTYIEYMKQQQNKSLLPRILSLVRVTLFKCKEGDSVERYFVLTKAHYPVQFHDILFALKYKGFTDREPTKKESNSPKTPTSSNRLPPQPPSHASPNSQFSNSKSNSYFSSNSAPSSTSPSSSTSPHSSTKPGSPSSKSEPSSRNDYRDSLMSPRKSISQLNLSSPSTLRFVNDLRMTSEHVVELAEAERQITLHQLASDVKFLRDSMGVVDYAFMLVATRREEKGKLYTLGGPLGPERGKERGRGPDYKECFEPLERRPTLQSRHDLPIDATFVQAELLPLPHISPAYEGKREYYLSIVDIMTPDPRVVFSAFGMSNASKYASRLLKGVEKSVVFVYYPPEPTSRNDEDDEGNGDDGGRESLSGGPGGWE